MTDYAEPFRPPSSQLRDSKATFGHTEGHKQNSSVQPTSVAMNEQTRQSLKAALAEIEELKQSQRVVEISLAKQIEEKEALKHLLSEQEKANEVSTIIDRILTIFAIDRRASAPKQIEGARRGQVSNRRIDKEDQRLQQKSGDGKKLGRLIHFVAHEEK